MERRSPTRENSNSKRPFAVPPPYGEVRAPQRSPLPQRTSLRPPTAAGLQTTPEREPQIGPTAPLILNVVLGAWLFLSAFLWPHTGLSFANTWISGALLALSGMFAHRVPLARALSGAVALWLVVSTLFIAPRVELTFWHNLIVGISALTLTFIPSARQRGRVR